VTTVYREETNVAELVKAILVIINRSDVSISIRNNENKFLYVNQLWEDNFHKKSVDIIGKTLEEIGVSSAQEIAASNAIDNLLSTEKSIIETTTYGANTKIMVIRALVKYKNEDYRVILAFNTATYTLPTITGWSMERADRVYAQILAARLQLIQPQSLLENGE
jgi:transcriptional regulator with PAS, ATPase and Fis domain